MKMEKIALILALAAMFFATNSSAKEVSLEKAKLVGDESIHSPYEALALEHSFITDESSQKLFDAMDF